MLSPVLIEAAPVIRDVPRQVDPIVRPRERLADGLVDGQNPRPDAADGSLVLQVGPGVLCLAVADLGAGGGYFNLEQGGALQLGGGDGQAAVAPAIRDDAVGDELHGPELLIGVLDEGGVAEEDGGAVVVVVAEGGEGEDEAVDVGGGGADGHAGGVAVAAKVHKAGGDVAVDVEVQGVAVVGAGAVEGAHLTDHGEDDGEGGVGRVEGEVDELGGVDDSVDGF